MNLPRANHPCYIGKAKFAERGPACQRARRRLSNSSRLRQQLRVDGLQVLVLEHACGLA